jgi:thioredoxin reductase
VPSRPISINIYCDDDLDFAENENLAVCGTGNNIEDAIENLKKHIVHFYEYYRKMDEDKLIGEALRLKDLYADLFIESGNAN